MKERLKMGLRRRDLLSIALAGAGAVATDAMVAQPALAKPVNLTDKRKARYQANSAEIQTYYRVNAYPAK